jgi:hypothetical protein
MFHLLETYFVYLGNPESKKKSINIFLEIYLNLF